MAPAANAGIYGAWIVAELDCFGPTDGSTFPKQGRAEMGRDGMVELLPSLQRDASEEPQHRALPWF